MFVAVCPACSGTVSGGDVCGCGYLHIDQGGLAYTTRGKNWPWQRQPNIPVREELEPSWEPPVLDEEPQVKIVRKLKE